MCGPQLIKHGMSLSKVVTVLEKTHLEGSSLPENMWGKEGEGGEGGEAQKRSRDMASMSHLSPPLPLSQ